jgi:hypothetical protein
MYFRPTIVLGGRFCGVRFRIVHFRFSVWTNGEVGNGIIGSRASCATTGTIMTWKNNGDD